MTTILRCINCKGEYDAKNIWRCEKCDGLLEVIISDIKITKKDLDNRMKDREFPYKSGVWFYKELIHPLIKDSQIVSKPEGDTNLYSHKKISEFSGVKEIRMKHEGENPTGSFKDRGMTVGISEANRLGCKAVGCASTGNTSASMASYAAQAGMKALIFIPSGEIAYGKLSQSLAYGAKVLQIKGNFDDAMELIQEACSKLGIYLLNSINPWRIEGQKTIGFELVQQMNWEVPDWIALPAGNLGNTSAIGKAIIELRELGFIDRLPRIASIQSTGADPFYKMWRSGTEKFKSVEDPHTIATAIKIGNPVSWKKALHVVKETKGTVEEVTDQEIMDAKSAVDASGIGCEPASAASLAGVKKLREKGVIKHDEKVVCILTGNLLKDPNATVNYHTKKLEGIRSTHANMPVEIDANLNKIMKLL
jgi:threonine synthase